ncbi:MAG: polysaccharide biosynthesis tyrosine autokinase [Gammaproteobacteria bacterium]
MTVESPVADQQQLIVHSQESLGEILLDAGVITSVDLTKILETQKKTSKRFGEVAIQLGLVRQNELQNALSRQVGYPCIISDQQGYPSDLVTAYKPFSEQSEIFRTIRTQLLLNHDEMESRPLAILSPSRSEGRSYVTANLAVVLAQLGKRTLVIDANLRAPRQHNIFQSTMTTGLSQTLLSQDEEFPIHQASFLPTLFVVPAGDIPPNPQELVSQQKFKVLLDAAAKYFSYVLIDTPSANDYSDAEIIASQAGMALIVSSKGTTPIKAVAALAKRLNQRKTDVVGCILNAAI